MNDNYSAASGQGIYAGLFGTTPLSDFIAAMAANSWAKYTGTNINTKIPAYVTDPLRADIAVFETDEFRKLTNWANKWGYDKSRRKIIGMGTSEGYIAGAKNYRGKAVEFDLVSNSFSVVYGPLEEQNEGHIYDRNSSITDSSGRFWCSALMTTGNARLWSRDPISGAYTLVTTVPNYTPSNGLHAVEVFPEWGSAGGVILFGQRGTLAVWDLATSAWTLIQQYTTDDSHAYGVCVYVNGHIIFGAGEGSSQLYKLAPNGDITAFSTSIPHPIHCKSQYKYIPSPVTGENACYSLSNDNMKMYRHNLDNDTWTEISNAPAVAGASLVQTVFTPLHGLDAIACFHGNGRVSSQDVSEFWVYKVS